MKFKKSSKFGRLRACFAGFLVFITILSGVMNVFSGSDRVYAEPLDETNTELETGEEQRDEGSEENNETRVNTQDESNKKDEKSNGDGCKKSLGSLGWLVCPATGKIAEATDWLYDKIEGVLQVDPIPAEDGSPIYEIWKYSRAVTNIVFIIFLLVVIYSQLTGYGISNYGIKKVLPKVIVVAILINLSFLICTLAIDVSNIIGNGIRGVFTSVEEAVLNSTEIPVNAGASMSEVYSAMAGGTALAVGGAMIAFELAEIWMLIPMVLGAIVSVVSGLITIALRQAVVALLVMISPLAIVAYMLPNTESWFKKWKKLLTQMLVFYPMFSLLFGASNLAGFAILAAAKDAFGVILGIAVQMFPLFFSWKLMKMSDTFLGNINSKIQGLAARPLAANRAWADSHRNLSRQKRLDTNRAFLPTTRLNQFLSNRKIAREEEASEIAASVKLRGQAYAANRNYRRNGVPSKEGEEAYERQARNMNYSRDVSRHQNNMNMGLGRLSAVEANATEAQKARIKQLDIANVNAADALKMEKARGEKIEYENARGFYNRMENAMNAHFDDLHGDDSKYKKHTMNNNEDRNVARARYAAMQDIMENDVQGIHYAAATAAHGYDTQKKIVESKMQKYFEYTPPTKDVEYRLSELTRSSDAIANVDSIISGLRVLNQRGDTDLVKNYMEDLLDHGVQLGSHASQALASFLMFEVKDNDPWLRRFGKYINLETARAYNDNDRQVMNVTYDEYIRGYHDGEPNTNSYPEGRMYAKKGMKQLVEGTPLDSIERTALSSFDDSLKKAYGYKKGASASDWKVDEYLEKREELQTAFEPAFLSASLKWLSGSEQINSGVKFWTGYELKQKKKKVEKDGKEFEQVVVDDDGNPVYEWTPVWEDPKSGFAGREKDVKEYFRRKTKDYFVDQTTGQILGMRTDYREPAVEHLLDMYLNDESGDASSEELEARRAEYEAERAEIQTRYGDEDVDKAKKKRASDLTKLKRKYAGQQLRSILDKTGKLEQIYVTRRSGASNNAKDWLRDMLNLDNKEEIYRYLDEKDKKNRRTRPSTITQTVSGDTADGVVSYKDPTFKTGVMANLWKVFDKTGDASDPDEDFFNQSVDFISKTFGADSKIEKDYREFKKNNSHASRSELFEKIEGILGDFFADYEN